MTSGTSEAAQKARPPTWRAAMLSSGQVSVLARMPRSRGRETGRREGTMQPVADFGLMTRTQKAEPAANARAADAWGVGGDARHKAKNDARPGYGDRGHHDSK